MLPLDGKPVSDPSTSQQALRNLAAALDAHLRAGDTDHNGVKKGSVPLMEPAPTRLSSKVTMTVQVPAQGTPSHGATRVIQDDKTIGIASDPSVLQYCGPSDENGRLVFSALGMAGTATVILVRPHHETLMPGVNSFNVEVVDAE